MAYGRFRRMSRRRRDIRRLFPDSPRRILRPMNGVGVMNVHHDEEARRAARAIVNGAPGFDMVGEAGSAEEALELAMALRPSLAFVAVGMPGIDGFETSRRLRAALPSTTVVLLYASVEPSEETLVGSQAVAALHDQALTPTALRTLWNEHGTG